MFVDTSALVAMVVREPDGNDLMGRLQSATSSFTSSIVVFECVLAVRRIRQMTVGAATLLVTEFLRRAEVELIPVESDDHFGALQAFDSYGKGTGHPAQLNLADCFSYALAKRLGVPLLYKGSDFSQTDLS